MILVNYSQLNLTSQQLTFFLLQLKLSVVIFVMKYFLITFKIFHYLVASTLSFALI